MISEKDADCIELECALRYAQKNAVDFVLHFKLERVQGMYFLAGDINSSKSLQSEKEIKFDATSSSEIISLINAELQPFLSLAETKKVTVKTKEKVAKTVKKEPQRPELKIQRPQRAQPQMEKPVAQSRSTEIADLAPEFLKTGRMELSPMLGTVPNNPMVSRYTGGLLTAYHFSETLAAEAAMIYSPDLGMSDLKGLTTTLVQIAHGGSGVSDFQQPVDKLELGATFAARWTPICGTVNFVGESVLSFDLYGLAGLGMLSILQQYAVYQADLEPPVALTTPTRIPQIPLNLGMGVNFFMNRFMALKLDARSYLYYAQRPVYDPNSDDPDDLSSRVYNTLVVSAGFSVFLP